jgi:hypothetical protein
MLSLINFLYRLMFAVLLAHELDATMQAEWRLLFILRDLPNAVASAWFITLHIPLFVAMIWALEHNASHIQTTSRNLLAVFMVVHAGVHYHLRFEPFNTFNSTISLALIYGGAVMGILYLALFIGMYCSKT